MAGLVSIDSQPPEPFKQTQLCLSGSVLDRLVDNSADIGTATMARRHIEACAYCREKVAVLKSFEARSRQPIGADRSKRRRDFAKTALAAASLLVAVGVGVDLRRAPEIDLQGPMIYRSAQFSAISPVGSVASAPAAFQWEPVAGAAAYQLSLMDVDRSEIWSVETSATTAPPPPEVQQQMTAGRSFWWTVVARNRAGEKVSETDLQKLYVKIAKPSNRKGTR